MKRARPTVAQDLRELLVLYDTEGLERLTYVLRILPKGRFTALLKYLSQLPEVTPEEGDWPRRTGSPGHA